MAYPSTTSYLARKLNWMARKLRSMNDPPTIRAWMEAMNSVFKTLQALSANEDLTKSTKIARRELDYQKAESI